MPKPPQGEVLAIEDGSVEEKIPTGCPMQTFAQCEQKEPKISVEEQLLLLQGNSSSLQAAALKRPASKLQGLKRPAAAEDAYVASAHVDGSMGSLQRGRGKSATTAECRVQGQPTRGKEEDKVKAIAKAKPKGNVSKTPKGKAMAKAKPKAKSKTKALPKGKVKKGKDMSAREQVRQAVLKKVPRALKIRFRNGCQKCRGRLLCTPSCWAERGYFP